MLWLISWAAAACELTGLWVIGSKSKWGFILNMLGGLAWIAVAIFHLPATGLLLVVVPALWINFRNFIRWRIQEKKHETKIITGSGQ